MCVCVCVCVCVCMCVWLKKDHVVAHFVYTYSHLMLHLLDEDVTDIYKQQAAEPEYCYDDLIITVQFEFDIDYVSPVCC